MMIEYTIDIYIDEPLEYPVDTLFQIVVSVMNVPQDKMGYSCLDPSLNGKSETSEEEVIDMVIIRQTITE